MTKDLVLGVCDVRGVVMWSLSASPPINLWGEESCREETQFISF